MAIHCVVLEKPLGEQPEGTVIQVDEEVATALVGAGIAREATEEDMAGADDEAPEEITEGEEAPLDNMPEMASVARNIEATVTKATERAVEKLATAAKRPSLNANKYVAGSDHARTGGYKNLGEACLGMIAKNQGNSEAAKKYGKFLSAHTKATGMSISGSHVGSDLVPQEWASELWRLSFKDVPDLLSMCQKYEMRNQIENIPSWVQASANSAITASVTNEASAITATVGTTATVQLQLVKGAALVNASDELLRFNSYNLTTVLQQVVGERLRFLVNGGIVNGTNGQVNLVGNAASVVVKRAANNAFSFADVVKMRSHLWESFRTGACWLVAPGSTPALYAMAFPNQSATTQFPVFVPGGFGNSLEAPPLGTLLGLPVYELENVPALGNLGDLILVHMPSIAAGYTGLIADSTPYLYFDLAQDSFRFLWYYDTVSLLTVPYTRQDGSDASNIVVLSGTTSSGE